MPKVQVYLSEITQGFVFVNAKNAKEAKQKAIKRMENNGFDDIISSDYEIEKIKHA